MPRYAERQSDAVPYQLPPRLTRLEPESAPSGSAPPSKAVWRQSRHHSHTLPCMSYRPHALGAYEPTMAVPCAGPHPAAGAVTPSI